MSTTRKRNSRRFPIQKKLTMRVHRQPSSSLRSLIADTVTACEGEDETLCFNTSNQLSTILKERGYTSSQIKFADLRQALSKSGSFVFVYFKYKIKYPTRMGIQAHYFILTNDNGSIYRIDSWEGIHPFAIRRIQLRRWYVRFAQFLNELESGFINKNSYIALFGEWDAEKDALEAAGEFISEYPDTAMQNIKNLVVNLTAFYPVAL